MPKHEAVLSAALDLFAERGFYGTAVPLIVQQAGVSAGTICRYFDSKEALANALYQQHKIEFSTALTELDSETTHVAGALNYSLRSNKVLPIAAIHASSTTVASKIEGIMFVFPCSLVVLTVCVVLPCVALVGCSGNDPGSTASNNNGTGGTGGIATPASGSLLITEMMPSTKDTPTTWFEIYNSGNVVLNLEGCSLSDGGEDAFMIEQAATVAPGSFAVLASASDPATDAPEVLKAPTYIFDGTKFELTGDSPDQVLLTCGGVLIDAAGYDQYKPAMARGTRALQLDPEKLDVDANDESSSWCNVPLDRDELKYDMHNHASPGASNPPCDPFPYMYYEQEDVLLGGIDFGATVEVATRAAAKGGTTSLMALWAVRDQAIDAANAARAGSLYLANVEAIYVATGTGFDWNFGVWHAAWAISNLYRNGSSEVKAALQEAYDDAIMRPATLDQFGEIANEHVLDPRPLMGDIHDLGRSLSQRSIVIPGNPDYLQSADDYR